MTRREVGDGWRLVRPGGAPVYENTEAMPRARVVRDFVSMSDESARELVARDGRAFRDDALVAPQPEAPKLLLCSWVSTEPVERRPCEFERDGANALAVRTDTRGPGMLVISDSYYPGWRAWMDGEPAPIHRVNYGFRGVQVPGGRHTVAMRYEPASFRVGLFVSLAALALLAAVGANALLLSVGQGLAPAIRGR